LRGKQIPLGARIISIANALDAMLSDCHYRYALPMSHAREEIRLCAGTQFDPKIVEVFLSIPETTGSSCGEISAHPSASLTCGICR
jgi:HD-GYP domain-containing protein (c-di-GMP phosphodiesterase class II)